jgi:hypothetical protein
MSFHGISGTLSPYDPSCHLVGWQRWCTSQEGQCGNQIGVIVLGWMLKENWPTKPSFAFYVAHDDPKSAAQGPATDAGRRGARWGREAEA